MQVLYVNYLQSRCSCWLDLEPERGAGRSYCWFWEWEGKKTFFPPTILCWEISSTGDFLMRFDFVQFFPPTYSKNSSPRCLGRLEDCSRKNLHSNYKVSMILWCTTGGGTAWRVGATVFSEVNILRAGTRYLRAPILMWEQKVWRIICCYFHFFSLSVPRSPLSFSW